VDALLALCAPGLEPFTARELRELGFKNLRPVPGGVLFHGGLEDVYRANLRLRTASRVLMGFGRFRADAFHELERLAAKLPWGRHLQPGAPVSFQVRSRRSRLYHERAVAERLAAASGAPLQSHDEDGLRQLFVVRIEDDLCTLYADSSGAPLHRRGYRLETAKAPLQETLACALVLASGWDKTSPLLDPFCGSGAIAIEAALLAADIAPGRCRRFAFMDWPSFDAERWVSVLDGSSASSSPRIAASDRDAGAVRAAQANAERAGVADRIEFSCRALSSLEPPAGPGWLVTNPPYGVRLKGRRDLRDLYARLGQVLRERFPGWRASVLCPDARLLRATGLPFGPGLPLLNGGLRVRASTCRLDERGPRFV